MALGQVWLCNFLTKGIRYISSFNIICSSDLRALKKIIIISVQSDLCLVFDNYNLIIYSFEPYLDPNVFVNENESKSNKIKKDIKISYLSFFRKKYQQKNLSWGSFWNLVDLTLYLCIHEYADSLERCQINWAVNNIFITLITLFFCNKFCNKLL